MALGSAAADAGVIHRRTSPQVLFWEKLRRRDRIPRRRRRSPEGPTEQVSVPDVRSRGMSPVEATVFPVTIIIDARPDLARSVETLGAGRASRSGQHGSTRGQRRPGTEMHTTGQIHGVHRSVRCRPFARWLVEDRAGQVRPDQIRPDPIGPRVAPGVSAWVPGMVRRECIAHSDFLQRCESHRRASGPAGVGVVCSVNSRASRYQALSTGLRAGGRRSRASEARASARATTPLDTYRSIRRRTTFCPNPGGHAGDDSVVGEPDLQPRPASAGSPRHSPGAPA